jgi:putative hydrolase of the HAD superfamily
MKALLFDLGRVLIGYDHAQTVAGLVSVCEEGAVSPEVVAALLQSVSNELTAGSMDPDELHTYFQSHARATSDANAFYAAFTRGISRDEEALAYALELEQRPNVLVAVISNTNAMHVRWLDAHLPELSTFDLVMMSNELGVGKPDPAVYRLALELLDVEASQALFVDDVEENVAAARALGIHGIVHSDWAITRPQIEAWLAGP